MITFDSLFFGCVNSINSIMLRHTSTYIYITQSRGFVLILALWFNMASPKRSQNYIELQKKFLTTSWPSLVILHMTDSTQTVELVLINYIKWSWVQTISMKMQLLQISFSQTTIPRPSTSPLSKWINNIFTLHRNDH